MTESLPRPEDERDAYVRSLCSHHGAALLDTRTRLARSVYHRCLGQLSLADRRRPRRRYLGVPFGNLGIDQRAMIALVLFGGLAPAQVAATLRIPAARVGDRLRHARG